jgi:hypothetical protein
MIASFSSGVPPPADPSAMSAKAVFMQAAGEQNRCARECRGNPGAKAERDCDGIHDTAGKSDEQADDGEHAAGALQRRHAGGFAHRQPQAGQEHRRQREIRPPGYRAQINVFGVELIYRCLQGAGAYRIFGGGRKQHRQDALSVATASPSSHNSVEQAP